VFFIFWGGELNNEKKLQKKNTIKALDGRRLIFFHATTNQKHAGVTEGGWDRPHDRARTLGEHDDNNEGDEGDDDKYGEDGDIPNDVKEYAGGRQTTKKYPTTRQKQAGSTGERRGMRRNWRGDRWERELIVLGQSRSAPTLLPPLPPWTIFTGPTWY
jgi:hypothetical protein